jgi:hypothetical protein
MDRKVDGRISRIPTFYFKGFDIFFSIFAIKIVSWKKEFELEGNIPHFLLG